MNDFWKEKNRVVSEGYKNRVTAVTKKKKRMVVESKESKQQ